MKIIEQLPTLAVRGTVSSHERMPNRTPAEGELNDFFRNVHDRRNHEFRSSFIPDNDEDVGVPKRY